MKNKKGFTLMEVILSIAIFGIIAIFVVTIFSSGLKNIYRSGKRTEEVFELESKINEEILNEDNGDVLIKVDIPGVGEKEIEGKMITISSDPLENQHDIEIITFIPNKPDETEE
ncbi:MAG: prepilin-type N-terminal cleavage/methylation domain-containing protein [Natronincolaceae bacterium]|jgi:prepilin-type N-terminal cleavage/methylation domain-containing protein